MTKEEIQTAINKGVPFLIKMADGGKHEVTDRGRISLGTTAAIVIAADKTPHILPLQTMTGISFRRRRK